ncbi:MAG: DNA polymerase IV, partial [Pseudomonadales bacterium]
MDNKESVRKIIHCDCDCFYAAVEIRDDPSLQGKPVAVGGSADRRGVLTTCNYEAREFGARSAMPTAMALRLCPDLIVLPVSMEKYRVASQKVQSIFKEFTEQIEPLSLDEAFLDVSDTPLLQGSATRIAQEIRRRVAAQVGITVSAGVAPNKFLAKIASDWQKPDGLTVIRPEQVQDFVAQLPVNKIFGVGKVTAAKLQRLGVNSCADLQKLSLLELDQKFGRFGKRLFELSRGVDPREVQNERTRKSLSVEHT